MVKGSAFHPHSENLTDCRRKALCILLMEPKPGQSCPCFMSSFIDYSYDVFMVSIKQLQSGSPKKVGFVLFCFLLFFQGLFINLSGFLAHLQGSAATRQWQCQQGAGLGLPVPPCCVLSGVPVSWRRVEKLELEGPSQALVRASPASKADPILQSLLAIAFVGMAAGKSCETVQERLGSSLALTLGMMACPSNPV